MLQLADAGAATRVNLADIFALISRPHTALRDLCFSPFRVVYRVAGADLMRSKRMQ